MINNFVPVSRIIANRIGDMIFIEKKYMPGDKLPSEKILSDELGVSRTTLREAIKMLVANGVLTIERGRGTFVTTNPNSQNDPFGISYLEDKKKLVLNWFEMRLMFEPNVVKLAVERATESDIEEIIKFEQEALAEATNNRPFQTADQRFHAAIAKATHNNVIESMLPTLGAAIKDAIDTAYYTGNNKLAAENVIIYHHMIADFIKNRDADGAALAMYYHIKRGITDLNL
ncbi:FadR/GntR family transcriptional regulator [Sedimentibacter sp.]|uniref:FadR/GntR family transcriptional regulator n=1 Tax=Sedimentibacter sp. TaxID=1960295 RepID=UPI0028AD4909|nr:FadR/GntR family transcriptional regulator [Sedimentibacter sp.]